MNATDYTMDPRNALSIRFLQSRPIQIGTSGFLFSVAQDLDNRGSLSKGQRESIESIAAKSNWQLGPALPPSVDDRGERVLVYVTPGCPPGNDFMVELGERYKPLGKIGVRVVHDPVFMAMLDPAPLPVDAPYRLFTSRGAFPLTGTGWARAGFKPRHAESADTLNDVVSPQLSAQDTEYRFRNRLVDGTKRGGGRRVGIRRAQAQGRRSRGPAGVNPKLANVRLTPGPLHLLVAIARGKALLRRYDSTTPFYLIRQPGPGEEDEYAVPIHARAPRTLIRLALIEREDKFDWRVSDGGRAWLTAMGIAAKSDKPRN